MSIIAALQRMTDGVLRNNWTPRVGDRVEFIRTPAWSGSPEHRVKVGDIGTITDVGHNYWDGYALTFSMDDGRTEFLEWFKFVDVRVLSIFERR